jgi:DNA-binding CsgD family transcriptional regulator/tetratricopeptide (TPR) repeat protein
VLLGRDTETKYLTARAAWAASGHGVAVLLEGEPGIGKSSLLDEVVARSGGLGMRVLWGRADALESQLPFSTVAACLGMRRSTVDHDVMPIMQLLRGERASLSSMSSMSSHGAGTSSGAAGTSSVVAANHDFVVTEAVLNLMDYWCAAGPVMLVVDDVQWADRQSAVVFNRLGRVVSELPLLMVLASRPVRLETAATLWSELTARGAETLRLGPLDEDAVAGMVAGVATASPGPRLRDVVAVAGGNPLYVGELVSALERECLIEIADGAAELVRPLGGAAGLGRIPQSLVEAIMRRLDFLPREARGTLQMAAVLGIGLDICAVAAVLDLPVVRLWEIVGLAIEAGLIVDRYESLVFRHELIRESLAEHLPAPVRTALHLRAARVLIAAGAAVERIAEHLLAGGDVDRNATDWLLTAADALIVRAPEAAVGVLRRALEAAENDEALAWPLRFQLVRALLWAGHNTDAEQMARQTLAGDPDPDRIHKVRCLLAQACFRQGRLADAAAIVEGTLTLPDTTVAESGRLNGFASLCYMFLADYQICEVTGERAIEAAEASGDRVAAGYGCFTKAVLLTGRGKLHEGLALADRAATAVSAGIQPDLQVDPQFLRGFFLLELNRLAEADETLAVSIRRNERSGGVVFLIMPHYCRARLRFLDGRWDDMLAEIQSTHDLSDPLGYAPLLYCLGTIVAVHRGTNRDSLDDLRDLDTRFAALTRTYVRQWGLALVAETRSKPRLALDLLHRAWDQPGGLFPQRLRHFICPDLARLAFAQGDRELLGSLATRTAEMVDIQPLHGLCGTALLCRGLADEDLESLFAAAGDYYLAGWPLFEGYAYEHAAILLAKAGATAQARDALDRALAVYTGLDAAWDIARAEARLRATGIRLGRRGHHKRPKTGWHSLTATEQKVAQLVAEGRSNPDIATRMFLSRRTVQSHVSSILSKLNLDSRVELAVGVAKRTNNLA